MPRMTLPAMAVLAAWVISLAATPPSAAATFRWANDGDVNAMDPATRQDL